MRAALLVAVLALPALAGCLAPAGSLDATALGRLGFDPAGVVAAGAAKEVLDDALRVVWETELPVAGGKVELGIPRGVTMVDARFTWPEGVPGVTLLPRESSPLRRCARFDELEPRTIACRGLTVLDPLPATWTFDLRPRGAAEGPVPFKLEAVLRGGALDGPAGTLRLDQLSMPHLGILDTEETFVPASTDGARLYVQVTRPDTAERVPAILLSSPYNNDVRLRGAIPYRGDPYGTIPDYVPRGYAVVVADVRGFGNSEGCVDVWGPAEQQDQYDLVEWIAAQPWSDGKVGMYGQSYVGTTPNEAAVLAPPHLAAIVTVAGLTDAYYDWHFGGVPNGEQFGSPFAYHRLGAETPSYEEDRVHWARLVAQSYCDMVPFTARANDPRGVYDDFYRERNLSARVASVKAPVLYTQGYFDENVKSAMAERWFNELPVAKKALMGPWFHRHPPRPDLELYMHAWLDQWLKGRDTGILGTPVVEALTYQGTWRGGDAWPPVDASTWALHLDAAEGALGEAEPAAAEGRYLALPAEGVGDVLAPLPVGVPLPARPPSADLPGLRFALEPLGAARYLSGAPMLDVTIALRGGGNTYVAAYLWEQDGDALRPVTFGMRNAALRHSYETYEPMPQGQPVRLTVPMLPTEWVVREGVGLVLDVRVAYPSDWGSQPSEPGVVTVHTGEGASVLRLPVLAEPGATPAPRTATVVAGS